MATEAVGPPMNQTDIINKYQAMLTESRNLVARIAEMEIDGDEHDLVVSSLVPLEGDRKAFRLIGEVLVQQTVAEVLPVVRANRQYLTEVVETLRIQLDQKDRAAKEWKTRFNIRTQAEHEAQMRSKASQSAVATASK